MALLWKVGLAPPNDQAEKPSLAALFADQLGAPWALGFLYAAGTAESIVVTLTSGWIRNFRFHGRAIISSTVGWG